MWRLTCQVTTFVVRPLAQQRYPACISRRSNARGARSQTAWSTNHKVARIGRPCPIATRHSRSRLSKWRGSKDQSHCRAGPCPPREKCAQPARRARVQLAGEREGAGGTNHTDRNAQFEYINAQADENGGREEQPKGQPERVQSTIWSIGNSARPFRMRSTTSLTMRT